MPKDAPWTDADTRTLIELWVTHSASQIAKELGRTRSSICGKANRLRAKGVRLAPNSGKLYVTPPPNAKKPNTVKRIRDRSKKAIAAKAAAKPGAAPPVPAPAPPLAPAQPIDDTLVTRPCTIYELDNTRCRWPLGPINERAILYCGGHALRGVPYCAHHVKRAYGPNAKETAT